MELVTSSIKDNILYIALSGRVDTNNADEVSAKIESAIGDNDIKNVIIDADELEHISSAGLRVVLKYRKMYPELKVINTSTLVYDIFDMTGFTEMMTVEKGYRKMSVEGCSIVGEGANGTVYRVSDDTIIKVYNDINALPDIANERKLARKAFVLGVPTAISYDIVRVDGKYGSVFELLNAQSLGDYINNTNNSIDDAARIYTDLLKTIHSTIVEKDDMPDEKQVVLGWCRFLKDYLEPDIWNKLIELVEAVPERYNMLHGDYHIKNVMLQNGEALLIDMDTLCYGDPVFEFASIYNAYFGFIMDKPDAKMLSLGISRKAGEELWDKTLKLYFGTDDENELENIKQKSELIGCVRLMRRLIRRSGLETEEGRNTISLYKNKIIENVLKLDSLSLAK